MSHLCQTSSSPRFCSHQVKVGVKWIGVADCFLFLLYADDAHLEACPRAPHRPPCGKAVTDAAGETQLREHEGLPVAAAAPPCQKAFQLVYASLSYPQLLTAWAAPTYSEPAWL